MRDETSGGPTGPAPRAVSPHFGRRARFLRRAPERGDHGGRGSTPDGAPEMPCGQWIAPLRRALPARAGGSHSPQT